MANNEIILKNLLEWRGLCSSGAQTKAIKTEKSPENWRTK